MNALLPLSWVYAAGVAVDRRAHLAPRPATGTTPRVVSIGNLEAGGNGKTPLAIWCLERAMDEGRSAAYVSRGYGGASVGARVVTCLLDDGTAPAQLSGLRILRRAHPDLAREIGDEGALVSERAAGATALFCADKRRAVETAGTMGAELVVLDDGFQSWRVPRHADIVLLDARAPFGGGRLLPAGRLREKPDALRRADAVVFNGAATEDELEAARQLVRPWIRDGITVAGMTRRATLRPASGAPRAAPSRLLVVSAIARPEAFEHSLAGAGVDVVAHLSFRDHHRYTTHDAARIAARAGREGADIVTTEKDWMKLRVLEIPVEVWLARLDVSLTGDPLPV